MSQSVATTPAVDVARRAYAAFDRGDIPAILELCAEDVTWSVPAPLPQSIRAQGREDVGRFFGRLAELWSDIELDEEVLAGDDAGHAIAVGRIRGRLRGAEAGYGYTHVWTVRDGAVVRFDEYVAVPEGGLPG